MIDNDGFVKSCDILLRVIPAKTGIQNYQLIGSAGQG